MTYSSYRPEPTPDERVTDDHIREAIRRNPWWSRNPGTPEELSAIEIREDGTWAHRGHFGVTYGEWYVDGPAIDILVGRTDRYPDA